MKGRIITGLLLVVALLAAASDGIADAATRRVRTVQVTGSLHMGPSSLPDPQCPAGTQYSGYPQYSGTFTGAGVVCGRGTGANPDGTLSFAEINTFTGVVQGCGTGSITYTVEGVVYPFDPVTQTLPAEEDWQIVAGSGMGGLRGIRSGGGHNNAQINADGSIDAEFNGTVRCVRVRS